MSCPAPLTLTSSSPPTSGKPRAKETHFLPLGPMDTNELVARHLDGDPRAFGELVRRYHDRLHNFIWRIISDRERAEDLVQETFVRVARHIHRFDHTRKFSTWVFVIASNLSKNELRSRRRSPLVFYQSSTASEDDRGPLQFEDPRSRPDRIFAQQNFAELVHATLARLSPMHRQVLTLREMEGRSYEEIGAIAGCRLGAVKSRLNRARTRFAALIAPHLD